MVFQTIVYRFGVSDIDLFASRINKKCNLYFSWHRDPEAIGVDAFTYLWSSMFFYAFPPFNLVLRVLNKIRSDQAQGIVVVPMWTSQPWFPLWESLLSEPPIIFEPHGQLLLSPCKHIQHPLSWKLRLMAGWLSGRPF